MNTIIIVLSLLAGLWVIGNLFTGPLQAYFLMRPEKLPEDFNFDFNTDFEEVWLEGKRSGRINTLIFRTKENVRRGAILYFHGNSGSLQRWGNLHEVFLPLGYDLLLIDYRGYGKSRGAKSERLFFNDAKIAYRLLRREYHAKDIIIFGRSMGSGPATWLASQVEARCLLLETPFSSVRNLFYTYYPFLPRVFIFKYNFDNYNHLSAVTIPVFIFQGTRDWVVPYKCAVRLKKKLKPTDKFIAISGGGHNNLGEFPVYRDNLLKALTQNPND